MSDLPELTALTPALMDEQAVKALLYSANVDFVPEDTVLLKAKELPALMGSMYRELHGKGFDSLAFVAIAMTVYSIGLRTGIHLAKEYALKRIEEVSERG